MHGEDLLGFYCWSRVEGRGARSMGWVVRIWILDIDAEKAVSRLPNNMVQTSHVPPLLLSALFMWPPGLVGLGHGGFYGHSMPLSSRSSHTANVGMKSGCECDRGLDVRPSHHLLISGCQQLALQ